MLWTTIFLIYRALLLFRTTTRLVARNDTSAIRHVGGQRALNLLAINLGDGDCFARSRIGLSLGASTTAIAGG